MMTRQFSFIQHFATQRMVHARPFQRYQEWLLPQHERGTNHETENRDDREQQPLVSPVLPPARGLHHQRGQILSGQLKDQGEANVALEDLVLYPLRHRFRMAAQARAETSSLQNSGELLSKEGNVEAII